MPRMQPAIGFDDDIGGLASVSASRTMGHMDDTIRGNPSKKAKGLSTIQHEDPPGNTGFRGNGRLALAAAGRSPGSWGSSSG